MGAEMFLLFLLHEILGIFQLPPLECSPTSPFYAFKIKKRPLISTHLFNML